jgi:hypothetical protein
VEFSLRTPLGIPVDDQDFDRVFLELERTGRLARLTPETITSAIRSLARDAVLQHASGRWRPGQADPADFVPGDAAAIRSIVCDAIVRDVAAATLLGGRPPTGTPHGPGTQWLLDQPLMASLLVDVATAVPYFIPTTAAAAVLASHPPHPDLRQDLRLPFERVLVLFGADLELNQSVFPWPSSFPADQASTFGVVGELLDRGGHLSGMVLLAGNDGRLSDDVVWLVAANPDPSRPWPASLDRIRGAVRGWRRFADLGPLADNVAAAVAWALWRRPPSPAEIPPNLPDRQLRKALKHNSVRVRERQGALVGVHVLDLGRTLTHAGSRAEDRQPPAAGRGSPIPHLRSGHFRRVRVGPRASFHYETRWIPPVWVQGDADRAAQRLVVRRLPPPATWTRTPGQEPHSIAEPGRPSPAVAAETPAQPTHQQVASDDSFGIDFQ